MAEPAPLSDGEVQAHLANLDHWELVDGTIRRRFRFENFRAALAFTNRVGMLAEEENHHPDFHLTGWNRLELVLFTHSIGALSHADVVMAGKIDALAAKDGVG